MAEEKQKRLESKFLRIFLVILAAFLTFAGPTYVVYALLEILNINYAVSMISGCVLFIVGLALVWYLIRNKIIS